MTRLQIRIYLAFAATMLALGAWAVCAPQQAPAPRPATETAPKPPTPAPCSGGAPPKPCALIVEPTLTAKDISSSNYLVVIQRQSKTELSMAAPTFSSGEKTYTIVTSKDWTCTPTAAQNDSVVVVCVRSDTPKK